MCVSDWNSARVLENSKIVEIAIRWMLVWFSGVLVIHPKSIREVLGHCAVSHCGVTHPIRKDDNSRIGITPYLSGCICF
jgi:hypothetical protein